MLRAAAGAAWSGLLNEPGWPVQLRSRRRAASSWAHSCSLAFTRWRQLSSERQACISGRAQGQARVLDTSAWRCVQHPVAGTS